MECLLEAKAEISSVDQADLVDTQPVCNISWEVLNTSRRPRIPSRRPSIPKNLAEGDIAGITTSSRRRNGHSVLVKSLGQSVGVCAVEQQSKKRADRDDLEVVGRKKQCRGEYVLLVNDANCE